jgi:ribosomal protein L11 methyltransferase
MPWLQLVFDTSADHAEPLSEVLTEAGAQAVTLSDPADQPIYEPPPGAMPLWQETRVTALFSADTELQPLLDYLQQQLGNNLPDWRLTQLDDRDWTRVWMEHFKPMSFGQRLWICPTGHQVNTENAVVIHLDPGLAFGSGTHATTALCLQWLDAHARQLTDCPMVIDYGCGSGVLAIAAALLGAQHIRAVDIDPQALIATTNNATRNNVASQIETMTPEQLPEEPADILLANILIGPLLQLAPRFASLLKPGGQLVLSGILEEQVSALRSAYQPWFRITAQVDQQQWSLLHAERLGK